MNLIDIDDLSANEVRESNHERLRRFAAASSRPVINAMSHDAHPCEVLADAYSLQSLLGPIESLRIGLWGPPTNVLRSWHALAAVLGIEVHHFCRAEFHGPQEHVCFHGAPDTVQRAIVTRALAA